MVATLDEFLGTRYAFKIGPIYYSGVFRGLQSIGPWKGMIFSNVKISNHDGLIPKSIVLCCHPLCTKCIQKDGFNQLRRLCRSMTNGPKFGSLFVNANKIKNGAKIV